MIEDNMFGVVTYIGVFFIIVLVLTGWAERSEKLEAKLDEYEEKKLCQKLLSQIKK